MNQDWRYLSGYSSYISGKPLSSLKTFEQKYGWKEAKRKFSDCEHKPVTQVAFGDMVLHNKKGAAEKFYKVLNNISISEMSQKMRFTPNPEADVMDFVVSIYRKNTLVLVKKPIIDSQ